MRQDAYETVRDQVGGCGIWCGSCAVGNGSLRELTSRYRGLLDSHGVGHWAPEEMDYEAFARGLGTIYDIAACPGCRQGGGRDDCPLRACSVGRAVADCTECEAFGACDHDELLQHMRSGARKAGLFVRDPGEERSCLLSTWIEELPESWPSLILFLEDA